MIVVAVPVALGPVLVLVFVRDDVVLFKTFLTALSTAPARASLNGSLVPLDILKLLIPRFDKVRRLLLWRLKVSHTELSDAKERRRKEEVNPWEVLQQDVTFLIVCLHTWRI